MGGWLTTMLFLGCGAGLLGGCGEEEDPARQAAASATPTRVATRQPAGEPRSLAQAVAAIERRADVPVVVPRNLPADMRFATAMTNGRGGDIIFLAPKRRALVIQYGDAGFDGCGPLHPRATRVGSAPAVINVSRRPALRHVALVWPATVERPAGRYGLSGRFPRAQIMRFAESMQAQSRSAGRGRRPPGC